MSLQIRLIPLWRPALTQSLKDGDHVVRRCAAISLGRIGPAAAAAAAQLADCLRDGNSQVREAAATSIARLQVRERIPHNVSRIRASIRTKRL